MGATKTSWALEATVEASDGTRARDTARTAGAGERRIDQRADGKAMIPRVTYKM